MSSAQDAPPAPFGCSQVPTTTTAAVPVRPARAAHTGDPSRKLNPLSTISVPLQRHLFHHRYRACHQSLPGPPPVNLPNTLPQPASAAPSPLAPAATAAPNRRPVPPHATARRVAAFKPTHPPTGRASPTRNACSATPPRRATLAPHQPPPRPLPPPISSWRKYPRRRRLPSPLRPPQYRSTIAACASLYRSPAAHPTGSNRAIAARSPALNTICAAPAQSARCSTLRVPGMGSDAAPDPVSRPAPLQAWPNCARRTTAQTRRSAPGWLPGQAPETAANTAQNPPPPACPGPSARTPTPAPNLPRASGENGTTATPGSAQVCIIPNSGNRVHSEYSFCTAQQGCTAWARRSVAGEPSNSL